MYELACPACNSPSQYDLSDFLLMCPFCSSTFRMDSETGQKEVFSDHFIIATSNTTSQVKTLVLEWLKRLNHKPGATDREYFITNINGLSIPFWVVSMEVHTAWKGLIKRQSRSRLEGGPGADFLVEKGQFKRNYRWAVSARHNICETWGMTRLHEPKEQVTVQWDGFPLDSTFSRGQILEQTSDKSAYDSREYFDIKFLNGLSILGIQVPDQEALRRARSHVEQYHVDLARLNVDHLIDVRSEAEIAGVQLIHMPFWYVSYVYRPKSVLRHFYRPVEKNIVLEGFNAGVLAGELPIRHQDKMWVNSIVTGAAAVIMATLGFAWHGAFLLVALFLAVVAGLSAWRASVNAAAADLEQKQPGGLTLATAKGK